MAKAALNGRLNSGGTTTYTVPALKYAILNVISNTTGGNVLVNGVTILQATAVGQFQKPVVIGAGDVLGISGVGPDFGYTGFLFDA
jgi:hypothetical protein